MLSTLRIAAGRTLALLHMLQIRNRDFSIIASNCAGTLPYRLLRLPYNTPTVNLYFFAEDYLRFVENLNHYLALPLRFRPESRFEQAELTRARHGWYPIGVLHDIEIHFMHYLDETEAEQKWERRKARINRDQLVLAFTDRDLCTPELLRRFDALPFRRKFVLTANAVPDIQCAIQIPHWVGQREIGDVYTHYETLAHVPFADLIDDCAERRLRTPAARLNDRHNA